MSIIFVNNASSLLALPALAADVHVTIDLADAGEFPTLTAGEYFYATLEDRRVVPNILEIVKVTDVSTNVLTVTRAQDGTVAQDFYLGAVFSARLCRAALEDFMAEEVAAREAADAAEAAARLAADNAEAAARAAADAAETAARIAADNAEIARAEAAELAEQAARIAADNAEAANRAAAIAAEAAARAAADAALATEIANEVARAMAAEAALGTRIDNEIADRIAADNALSSSIGGIVSTIGGSDHLDGAGHCRVTFSTPFPTACRAFVVTGAAIGVWSGAFNINPDRFGCDVWGSIFGSRTPAAGVTFFWMAIGY
jgi:hypothetical protein